ncbi:hypothetical protein Tco_0730413 [Tanacetum coccineum]|uniref:Aminotransferase-like plant mobile domain-containing protein n=1 Tax=Tanacetum coccineum TaxID=301880 RepID=A0ABQ4YUH9_9ASTR
MSKNDMKNRICTLSKKDLKDLVKTYRIPLDLHSRLPDPGFTMDCLPGDAIGIYSEFLWFFGVCIPFSTFLLSILKYFKVHISQLAPLDRKAILDYLTWRHFCSCVSNDLPIDGYDRNAVERLCARLICLLEMREEVLVRSGLSSVWFNKECDLVFRRIDDNAEMCIYDFMTLPSWSDAKVAEESHHLSLPLLERVPSHTTAPAAEGAIILLPTPDEIAASLPDSRLAKKSKGPSQAGVRSTLDTTHEPSQPSKKSKLKKKASEAGSNVPELDQVEGVDEAELADFCAEIEGSLERDEGAPSSIAVVSDSEPSYYGTSAPASTSGRSLSLGGAVVSGHAGKSGAEVMRRQLDPLDSLARSALARDVEYDQIPDDDFGTATRSEEIDLTLFPLAPGRYHMPYPDPYDLNSVIPLVVSCWAHLQEKLDQGKGMCLTEDLTRIDAKLSEQALTVRDLQNELSLERYVEKVRGLQDAPIALITIIHS